MMQGLKIQFICQLWKGEFRGRAGQLSSLILTLFFCTENSLYAYSLKDLHSAATGMEMKLPGLEQDPQWEKNIDHATHRFSLLRWEVLVEQRAQAFLAVWLLWLCSLLAASLLD